jgi:hypothetical protein
VGLREETTRESDDAGFRAQRNSVFNLQELYTVAVGASLALAIDALVDVWTNNAEFPWHSMPMFTAFLATMIPFYHGAVRHLEDTYIEKRGANVRAGALLADFLMLFVEGFILIGIARLLPEPELAAWGLIALLGFDTVWGLAVYLAFSRRREFGAEIGWVVINAMAVPLMAIYFGLFARSLTAINFGASLFLFRTVVDYLRSWHFYFPSPRQVRTAAPS